MVQCRIGGLEAKYGQENGGECTCEISDVLGVKGVAYVCRVATGEIDWCSGAS